MKPIAAIALIFSTTAGQSLADGKMFWPEKVPPKVPYQRALILFGDQTETLVLQSKYEINAINEASNLGWVVPVPAVPEVASMPAVMAHQMFLFLSMNSRPQVTRIVPTVFALLFFGIAGLSLLTLLICLVSCFLPIPQWIRVNRGCLARYSMYGLLVCLLVALGLPAFAAAGSSLGVEVVAQHRVGIYEVSVVRTGDADGLIDWLNKHDFNFGEQDTAVFDSYVSKGWCFVVAIINPITGENERRIVSEGLAAPLILRFPHEHPIYPVALTGTGGFETEILIYLASSTKMSSHDRLTLRFAGKMYERSLELLSGEIEPEGFFDPKMMNYPYLCKFKDRLTPEKMGQDIIFRQAKDEEPYREHIVKW